MNDKLKLNFAFTNIPITRNIRDSSIITEDSRTFPNIFMTKAFRQIQKYRIGLYKIPGKKTIFRKNLPFLPVYDCESFRERDPSGAGHNIHHQGGKKRVVVRRDGCNSPLRYAGMMTHTGTSVPTETLRWLREEKSGRGEKRRLTRTLNTRDALFAAICGRVYAFKSLVAKLAWTRATI